MTAASDRLRLDCMKKSGSLPRFVPNRVFPIFFICHACLTPSVSAVMKCIEKIPRTREAKRLQTKGERITNSNISRLMHSLIFQISDRPIEADDHINIDLIEAGETVSIDYCMEIESDERNTAIIAFFERTFPQGMFTINPDEETVTYQGGFNEWNSGYIRSLIDKAKAVTEANVFKYAGAAYRLQQAIVNPLDTAILFVTDFTDGMGTAERSRSLMRLISELQIGAKLYIGAILDYHY